MAIDLNALTVFVTIADAGNFRLAAERLGVTRSAVSQSLRRLEDELGVALILRTTRSARLTDAGARLRNEAAPALAQVGRAVQAVGSSRAEPSGSLRIAVSSIAERFLSGPLVASFADEHPHITLDVTVTDAEFDIVAAGYDAGVRLGEVIEKDMIAIPVSTEQRQMVVGAPSYLARHGRPTHPRDLINHRCIGWRSSPDKAPYRWEFTEAGRDYAVSVVPQITTNDMLLMIRAACAAGGLTFGMEETFRPYIERRDLVPLLEEFCPPFPGFHLYFPNRRNIAPAMRALIDHVRVRN
jgi:DNA-binding transcriptional LysR family regulator